MAFAHRGGQRDQRFLLPPSLDEWLPEDHLARFVVSTVERLDLSGFARPHRADGKGRRSYDPKMLVALVLFAWCEGQRSSRRIERCCVEQIPFRWITGNDGPDHTTIARFIKDRAVQIDGLFVQVLRLAFSAGMGQVGVVAIDGTKVAADASPLQSMTRKRLEDEVRRIRAEHQANDDADDERFGDRRGDELPAALADPATRDARIAEALRQIEAEDAAAAAEHAAKVAARTTKAARPSKPSPPTDRKANVTDPDCRVMKGPRGFGPAYNAQAAVSQDQLIVAVAVTQDRVDNDQLAPMIEAVAATVEALDVSGPATIVADAGYWNPTVLSESRDDLELLVPPPPNKHRTKLHRRGPIPRDATLPQRMERTLATARGKALHKQRAATVEPVFGQIKAPRGIRTFRRRGLTAARHEWQLIATTHNLLKMWRNALAHA